MSTVKTVNLTLIETGIRCQDVEVEGLILLRMGEAHCEVSVNSDQKIIFIEPFYGGSHKALLDTFLLFFPDSQIISLPAKKWHWRARCGAFMMYDQIPEITSEKILFCSSVLNLTELLGLRPDLQLLKKVVYFHENQLIYPVQEIKARDIQYAYNQITTCLSADVVLFNSNFNKTSFLNNLNKIIKLLPDRKPKNIKQMIEDKSKVIYFPVSFPKNLINNRSTSNILHIVWPHRWEFDKGPEEFFSALFQLKENNISFKLSVLGESFSQNPSIFTIAKDVLKDEIVHFGFVESKTVYYNILCSAHVVVSTAKHEFFGVSMLEAAYCGCYPLVPNSLVYPEIYPVECLYSTAGELVARLTNFSSSISSLTEARNSLNIDFDKYSSLHVVKNFMKILDTV